MTYKRKMRLTAIATALSAGVSIIPASIQAQELSQTADGGAAPAASAEQGLGDIVVTARRRSESLLETPVAVTAFSTRELERRSIHQVSEIQKSTPSLIYEGTGGNASEARIFIRGVGNAVSNVSAEQGVGIYIDGMYFARAQGAMLDNLDIASVEVLRGPQGTLFGKNTIGGAVNISTIRPDTDAVSGSLEAGYGRFAHVRVRGAINIPLAADKLAVRFSVLRDKDNGYSVNDFNGRNLDNRDIWAFSGALRFTPTDNLTWDVNAMYSRDRNHGRAARCIPLGPDAVYGAAYIPLCAATGGTNIRHTNLDAPLNGYMDMAVASSTIAWNVGKVGVIDDLTFKAIVGYQWADSQRVIDYDGTPLNGIWSEEVDKQTSQISGEFQILGRAFEDKLNFVFGAYADKERTPGEGIRPSTIYPVIEPFGLFFSNVTKIKLRNQSKALYSQITYDLNQIVSVTGGIRYTDDTKGFSDQRCPVSASAPLVCVGPLTTDGLFTTTSKTWTPMGNIQLNVPEAWTGNGFIDKGMIYFTYSKGFKSGGFNGNGDTVAGTLTPFKPEHVENYEVGAKFSLFDRRLTGSVTRYDMTYKNMQLNVQAVDPVSGAPTASVFNAGAAKIQGIEVELEALLFDSLRLGFNGDFSEPRFTRFDDLRAPGGTRTNEPMPYIPPYRVSGSIENRFEFGNGMALTPRVQVTRTGRRYLFTDLRPTARALGRVAPVTLVDALLRLDVNDKMSVEAYGKNIFDKKYMNDALAFSASILQWFAPPATYGVTARYKF